MQRIDSFVVYRLSIANNNIAFCFRKLKNRVAAQTSRDRKKAKLDELEDSVKLLKDQNDHLARECALLRSQNESLVGEVRKLRRERQQDNDISRKQVNDDASLLAGRNNNGIAVTAAAAVSSSGNQPQSATMLNSCQGSFDCDSTTGSAESPLNPLPQGGMAQSKLSMTVTPLKAALLLRILTTLCLFSTNSSTIYKRAITSSSSRSSLSNFYAKLQTKWTQILAEKMNK